MYAIMKGNLFVSKPGMHNAYTSNPENAQTFRTLKEAKRECCGNEHIVILTLGSIRPVPKEENENGTKLKRKKEN